ncbi:MAG: polysaccharide biosynthesis protein, partial [Exiguobacterium marinum]|uniref:polysaccharide biosynthesis protein n=1 Tax=Exiguobacterium marinum TaxID=273528 RepID=UPI003C476CD3
GEIFIPKIPSMSIIDLAEAIAPECDIKIVGIRPGEKLHEAMITEDDARHTLEYDDYFVIQPEFPWWSSEYSNGGKSLPEGFTYVSNVNNQWLSVDELRELVK